MNCNNDRNVSHLNSNDNSNRFIVNNMNSRFPENVMYGYAYVPIQRMGQIFRPEDGLSRGTIFPELVSNYEPCDSMEEIMYLRGGRQNG